MTRKSSESGMALLLVLVVVTLLTAVLMELSYSTLIEQRLTETFRDSTRAYYLARGGITAGQKLLLSDKNNYDAPTEFWATGISSYPVGEGFVSVAVEDLDGKLSVNSLVVGNNPQTFAIDRFYRLLSTFEIDEPAELTAAIIDWLDQGDEPYQMIKTDALEIPVTGAEDFYYQQLALPYSCKNGPLESLEELRLVKGFSEKIFNIVSPYLSVTKGKQININTAKREVLLSLGSNIEGQTVDFIIAMRREAPIQTLEVLKIKLSADQYSLLKSLASQRLLGTTSDSYKITAEAVINDGRRSLETRFNKKQNVLSYIRTN
jgi:general secretion pathway protein K